MLSAICNLERIVYWTHSYWFSSLKVYFLLVEVERDISRQVIKWIEQMQMDTSILSQLCLGPAGILYKVASDVLGALFLKGEWNSSDSDKFKYSFLPLSGWKTKCLRHHLPFFLCFLLFILNPKKCAALSSSLGLHPVAKKKKKRMKSWVPSAMEVKIYNCRTWVREWKPAALIVWWDPSLYYDSQHLFSWHFLPFSFNIIPWKN